MRRGRGKGRRLEGEESTQRRNEQIRVPRVLVIDENGTKLGILGTREAIDMARERGLDLVEVAANARPPVCRFADFGKMQYDRKKREAKARRNSTTITIKEVKMTPKLASTTSIKARHAQRFLRKVTRSRSLFVSVAVRWLTENTASRCAYGCSKSFVIIPRLSRCHEWKGGIW